VQGELGRFGSGHILDIQVGIADDADCVGHGFQCFPGGFKERGIEIAGYSIVGYSILQTLGQERAGKLLPSRGVSLYHSSNVLNMIIVNRPGQ
jgi:hypothetical protein